MKRYNNKNKETVWLEELRIRLTSLGLTVCFLDMERLGPFDPARAFIWGFGYNFTNYICLNKNTCILKTTYCQL